MARRRSLSTEPVEVVIDHIGRGGMGVGQAVAQASSGGAGRRLLVKGTLPGERVLARARTRRGGYTVCRLEEVLEASPERVVPACAAFADCGGCAWQHVDADRQLAGKEDGVRGLFAELGVHVQRWLPPTAGPRYGYRHKARLGVRWVPDKGGALVGFREPGSSKVARIDTCEILAPRLARLIVPLRELIGQMDAPRSIPQLEVAAGDNDAAMVVRHLEVLSSNDRERWQAFAAEHDTHVLLQDGGPDTVVPLLADDNVLLSYAAHDIHYRFHPLEFTQVNPYINAALMTALAEHLPVAPTDNVLDLFCGLGNFSLQLARRAATVTGVEGDAALVSRARDNAAANGFSNTGFEQHDLYAEDVGQVLTNSAGELDCDVLLLDPPRSGAGALTDVIGRTGPATVGYISCNPETLASDLARLQTHGYGVTCAGVFDMFPHTAHCEVFAVLART